MSIVTPGAQERFHIRIYKELTTTPSPRWANTYEVRNEGGASMLHLLDAVQALYELERAMHLTDVRFDRAVLSTWIEDGTPYDPSSFTVIPLGLEGTVVPSGGALPLNVVLHIRRKVIFGRPGKVFWRRALGEGDIEAPAGRVTLSAAAEGTIETRLAAAMVSSDAIEMTTEGTNPIKLILAATGQPDRLVDNLLLQGANVTKFDNRYFDVP